MTADSRTAEFWTGTAKSDREEPQEKKLSRQTFNLFWAKNQEV